MHKIAKHAIAALGLALPGALAAGAVRADELRPLGASSVALGEMHGVVYYTVRDGGYEVVATLAQGADTQPVRFIATLRPGQSVQLSVPGPVGTPGQAVRLLRDGDHLELTRTDQPAG